MLVGGVAPAAHYNPPTTACGATSVFETPSVLRESLPSYSAKPGAFYAPRALRWTVPKTASILKVGLDAPGKAPGIILDPFGVDFGARFFIFWEGDL